MKLSDFDFDLPEGLIATRPVTPRRAARMLVARPDSITDSQVEALPDWLNPGDRLILNDTSVIPARLTGQRCRKGAGAFGEDAVARIEVTLLTPHTGADGAEWSALVKPLRKLKTGDEIVFSPELSARLIGKEDGQARLAFNLGGDDFDAALSKVGLMPLPPYIAAKRPADARDNSDYQTIFARVPGAVAAPTASLHFDEVLLAALQARGVDFSHVTLHVGAGTFLPVKADDIADHVMHSERGEVTAQAAAEINATKQAGGRIIPVGTTALRLIETAARATGQVTEWQGSTDIFITPGFQFKATDGLMTNFHLPKSTLMMLVSALMGPEQIRAIYAHAVAEQYRFFSYGDSSLLLP